MSANGVATLTDTDITLTGAAQQKLAQLVDQVEEEILGVRVYVAPGGCSGVSFGMTFADQVGSEDDVLNCRGFDLLVDRASMHYLRGVEIDYLDNGDGAASFVFNNLPSIGGGCGTCGSSQGGGCA